jgi:hypothetical protein
MVDPEDLGPFLERETTTFVLKNAVRATIPAAHRVGRPTTISRLITFVVFDPVQYVTDVSLGFPADVRQEVLK